MQNEPPPAASSAHPPSRLPLPALAGIDPLLGISALAVAAGWFLLDTLHVRVGPFEHGVRFFDVASIIARPVRLMTGVDHSHVAGTVLFGLLCCGALAAPFSVHFVARRKAWLGNFAPLALMLACAVLLYARTSGEILTTSNDPAAITNDIFRFANDLIHRGGDIAARSVSIGAGAWLALAGAAALAVRGMNVYRKLSG